MVGKQPIVLLKTVDWNKFLPIWIGHPGGGRDPDEAPGRDDPAPDDPRPALRHARRARGQVHAGRRSPSCARTRSSPRSRCRSTAASSRSTRARRDALALAVRSGAPIFAAEDVIAESAIEFEHEVEDTEEVVEKFKDFLDQVSPEDFAGGERVSAGLSARRRRRTPAPAPAPAAATISSSKSMPGRVGRLRQQARCRSGPGPRWPRARTARRWPPRASGRRGRSPRQPSSRRTSTRERLGARRSAVAELGRADEARAPDLVARLEVVEVLVAGGRPRRPAAPRRRAPTPRGRGRATWRSSRTLRVVGERGDQRAGHVGGRVART